MDEFSCPAICDKKAGQVPLACSTEIFQKNGEKSSRCDSKAKGFMACKKIKGVGWQTN